MQFDEYQHADYLLACGGVPPNSCNNEHKFNFQHMTSPLSDGGFELAHPPKDGISSLRFFKDCDGHSSNLLVTSWDGSIQVHDTQLNKLISRTVPEGSRPILDACVLTPTGLDTSIIWAGGLSGSLYWCPFPILYFISIDWKSGQLVSEIKKAHEAPIKSIIPLSGSGLFFHFIMTRIFRFWWLGFKSHALGIYVLHGSIGVKDLAFK